MSKYETHRQEQSDPIDEAPAAAGPAPAPGYRWAPCCCAEIDPSDRPCPSCEAQGKGPLLTPEAFAAVAVDVALDEIAGSVKPLPKAEDEARRAGVAAALELLAQPRKALELIAGLVALLPRDKYSRPELRLPMSPEAVALLLALGGKATKTMVTPSRIAEGAELELGGLQVVASAPMRPLNAEDLPEPELHRCAVSTCPGLPYRASEFAHPCREPAPTGSAS